MPNEHVLFPVFLSMDSVSLLIAEEGSLKFQ